MGLLAEAQGPALLRGVLHAAARRGLVAVLVRALDAGCDVDERDDRDRTPLMHAADAAVATLLAAKGADVNARTTRESAGTTFRTPVVAYLMKVPSAVAALLPLGLDADAALYPAASVGVYDVWTWLLDPETGAESAAALATVRLLVAHASADALRAGLPPLEARLRDVAEEAVEGRRWMVPPLAALSRLARKIAVRMVWLRRRHALAVAAA